MKLDDMPWRTWPGFVRLADVLDAGSGATRIVGGAVRDILLALPVSDVDLATRFTPDEVVRRLEAAGIKAVPTGLAHGTVTAVCDGKPFEVTTLRRDVETDGRHARVAFTDSWEEDASRRDFSINALYADPSSGEVFDYFGGLADLAGGPDLAEPSVRFIGDPLRRIAEDHLRILRFFRFHARFSSGIAPDRDGLAACTARANDLMALSRERIADEMLKLLALPAPDRTLAVMVEAGILVPVLPEIDADGVRTLTRLLAREAEAGLAGDSLRRLAAVLPADPRTVDAVAARLRLSKAARARLASVAARGPDDAGQAPAALAYRHGAACARDRLLLADSPDARRLAALDGWEKPKLPIAGGALIALGLPAGPIVATTLREIETAWVDAGFPDRAALGVLVNGHVAKVLGRDG